MTRCGVGDSPNPNLATSARTAKPESNRFRVERFPKSVECQRGFSTPNSSNLTLLSTESTKTKSNRFLLDSSLNGWHVIER
jgi:hypothetical protein